MSILIKAIKVIVIISLFTSSIISDERSGLIKGIGISFTPLVKTHQEPTTYSNTGPLIGFDLCMGYAFNHRNVLVLMADAVFPEEPEAVGYIGPIYFHYSDSTEKSLYLTAGIGLQYSAWSTAGAAWSIAIAKPAIGPGVRAGLGYEFARNRQLDFEIGLGRSYKSGDNYSHVQVNIGLRFLSY
jgi:hypothetical protein